MKNVFQPELTRELIIMLIGNCIAMLILAILWAISIGILAFHEPQSSSEIDIQTIVGSVFVFLLPASAMTAFIISLRRRQNRQPTSDPIQDRIKF